MRRAIVDQDLVGFGLELGIARKDPTAVLPGFDGVNMEPTPDRRATLQLVFTNPNPL
jgi:hypothetical protein